MVPCFPSHLNIQNRRLRTIQPRAYRVSHVTSSGCGGVCSLIPLLPPSCSLSSLLHFASFTAFHPKSLLTSFAPTSYSLSLVFPLLPFVLPYLSLYLCSPPYSCHFSLAHTRTQAELSKLTGEVTEEDKSVVMMKAIHSALRGPITACCFKIRDVETRTVQRRWSVVIDGSGTYSTWATPVFHIPKVWGAMLLLSLRVCALHFLLCCCCRMSVAVVQLGALQSSTRSRLVR